MSKFKNKKGGEIPAVNTASLPDIVFMLLFFFMVVTVLRQTDLLVKNELPKADQIEKLKKEIAVYVYAGKPSARYQSQYGSEGKIQIGDKYTDIKNLKPVLEEQRQKLPPILQSKVMVALKVDKETNTGIVTDIKQTLRELNMLKIIYITAPGNEIE